MKKLMVLALAAAAFGAFGACAEDPVGDDCAYAYKLTFTGKTTAAYTATTVKANPSKCIEGKSACYRKQASFKWVGYIYGTTEDLSDPDQCIEGCACNDFSTMQTILWDNKTKVQVTGSYDVKQLDLIGTDAKKAEVVAQWGDLTLAGFGTYDTKKLLLKSVSGNFAGQIDAPKCETCTYDTDNCEDICESTDTVVFTLCTLDETSADTTAAYGCWTLKYDSSATKKLQKNYDISILLPKNFTAADAN